MDAPKLERNCPVTIPNLPPFYLPGYPVQPLPDVVPFTSRSGATFAEVFYQYRDYIDKTVIPSVNTNQETLVAALNQIAEGVLESGVEVSAPIMAQIAADDNSVFSVILSGLYAGKGVENVVDAAVESISTLNTSVGTLKTLTESGRLSEQGLTNKIAAVVPSVANVKVNPLEGVAFVNYGDSYGNGAQGADQASRPFNRLAKRHATADLVVRSVAGTRMDQIAAAILSSWTPNSRGLIGFSDGVINDLKQYANDTGRTTTREAFRTCLALLTAKAINTPGSAAIAFDANWSGGVTTTQSAFARVACTAPRVYLILGFYAGAARTVTIQRGSTVLATVNTGGYANDFPGVVEITGLTGTTELTITATTGGARIYGVAIPSAYPPVIVWDKPGRYSSNNTEATRLALYLSECASILGNFPSVVPVDMGAAWDYTTMIAADATHRNDWGNIHATDRIDAELMAFLGGQPRQGLNRLILSNNETGADVTYAVPNATPIIVINNYAADDFNRADSASLGTTPTGSFAWTPLNSGVWSISGNQLVASSGVAPTAPNDVLIDDGQVNGTIQYTVKQLTSSGCAFRVSGTGNVNGYIVWSNGTTLTLSKRTGANAYSALGTGGTVAVNDVIKIVLNGSSIRVFKNNVEVITVTDSSYTGTKHGFWSNGTGSGAQAAQFDSFSHDERM